MQTLQKEGAISIQTRTSRFGKLCNGTLLKSTPQSISSLKTHFLKLECGVDLILGMNGWIWVYQEGPEMEVPVDIRRKIARVSNCVRLLIKAKHRISDVTLNSCVELTNQMKVE